MSWVSQYQGMSDYIPGIYALNVNANSFEGAEYDDEDDDYWVTSQREKNFSNSSQLNNHFVCYSPNFEKLNEAKITKKTHFFKMKKSGYIISQAIYNILKL